MLRAIGSLFGAISPKKGELSSFGPPADGLDDTSTTSKLKKTPKSKVAEVTYNPEYRKQSFPSSSSCTPLRLAGATGTPSSRRVRFSGHRDVRHYDLTSPPSCRHPVDTTRVKATDVRKHLDFIVSSRFQNTRLQLEQLGARMFSIHELDNALSEADVGVRTFADAERLKAIPEMSRSELVDALCVFFFRESLEQLDRKQLIKFLQEKLSEDIRDAQHLRNELVNRELDARKLSLQGDFAHRVALLRQALQREEQLCALEDSHLDKLRIRIGQENRLDALREKVNQVHCDTLRQELASVGLGIDTSGTHTELGFRHKLWKDIEWKSHVRFAAVNPDLMNLNELESEFEEHKLCLRESFKASHSEQEVRQEMINVLRKALLEDLEKGPIKYDFGCQYIQLEDLEELTDDTIKMHLKAAGVDVLGKRFHRKRMVEQLRTILVERTHDKYIETVEHELAHLGVSFEKGCDFGVLFSLLEVRKKEQDQLQPIAELHSPTRVRSPSPQLHSLSADSLHTPERSDDRLDSASSLFMETDAIDDEVLEIISPQSPKPFAPVIILEEPAKASSGASSLRPKRKSVTNAPRADATQSRAKRAKRSQPASKPRSRTVKRIASDSESSQLNSEATSSSSSSSCVTRTDGQADAPQRTIPRACDDSESIVETTPRGMRILPNMPASARRLDFSSHRKTDAAPRRSLRISSKK